MRCSSHRRGADLLLGLFAATLVVGACRTEGAVLRSRVGEGGAAPGDVVTGAVGDGGFAGVSVAYWLGVTDEPGTTLVYLFESPVACAELAGGGWDTRIGDGNQLLKLLVRGASPGTYPVVESPGQGQAAASLELANATGGGGERGATGGAITLSSLTAGRDVAGTFNLTFGDGALAGTFDGLWCPAGEEP
jgi:hypothetical protein